MGIFLCVPNHHVILFLLLAPYSSPFALNLQKAFSGFAYRSRCQRNGVVSTYDRNYTSWCHTSRRPSTEHQHVRPGAPQELSYSQVFESLQVKPPLQVPPGIWRWCFYVHQAALRLLHFRDSLVVPNSALSSLIMWWKALVGNDQSSPAFDQGWAHDLLPSQSRWIFRIFRPFFPRLNHANIELRTVYLNGAIQRALAQLSAAEDGGRPRVRLVVLGAGYDLRGTRLLTEGAVDDVIELDLPGVMEAKERLLTQRLAKRRSNLRIPKLVSTDLNDSKATQELLCGVLGNDRYVTVFVLEGILVHLSADASHALLGILSSISQSSGQLSCLIFADALPRVTQRRLDEAIAELHCQGWTLTEFLSNPTKAPHMGLAVPTAVFSQMWKASA